MAKTTWISGPDPTLEPVYSDVWLPGLYSRRVFVFELPSTSSHEKAVAVLERALQALVQGTPELGGITGLIPSTERKDNLPWISIDPYKGIEFIVKDLISTLPSYAQLERRGFPLGVFKDSLLMPIPTAIGPPPCPVAKFQATLIDGGILLSTCIHHHLSDGNGMNAITRALGEACKRAAESSDALPPVVLDTSRAKMINLQGTQTDLSYHPAHSMAPGVYRPDASHDAPPDSAAPPAPSPDFLPGFYRLSDAQAERLKADASAEIPCSTHDAISALLWRTHMLARLHLGKLTLDTKSTFTFPHNARRYVGLSPDWVGNCVYFCIAEMPVSALTKPTGLASAAAHIRRALNAVDPERVAGIMTLRRPDPYSLAWWPVGEINSPRVLGITSFYHSGLRLIDWGSALGPVRHFTSTDLGPFAEGFRRASFVGPKIGSNRGCDVLVGVDPDELAFIRTDEVWNRYFEPLASEPLAS